MEDNDTNEVVTLVLGDVRAEVHKQKLANHSQYFASLFSHGFKDSEEREHVLNYQIEPHVVQDFANWINNYEYSKNHPFDPIKVCMIKFLDDCFNDLLSLLRLSTILISDTFADDIIYIIVQYWLHPDKVIDIWLLAEELGNYELRDICIEVCLDRFSELPISLLVCLSKENLTKLIGNVNVRGTKEYLRYVLQEWALHNSLAIPEEIDLSVTRKPKYVQAMLAYVLDTSGTKKAWVYSWDGVTLSQIVELKDVRKYHLHSSTKALMGMQVTGRGCSIYMIGGEFGLGTGHFNKMIWRYCLISKRWYYQASLPSPRRHMITVFLKNKLFLMGGVGQHRLKLSSIDVLDIYTGAWTKAVPVPECFTEVPSFCVHDQKLFVLISMLYIYHHEIDYWENVEITNRPAGICTSIFMSYDKTLFLSRVYFGESVLTRVTMKKGTLCVQEGHPDLCSNQIPEVTAWVVFPYYNFLLTSMDDIGLVMIEQPGVQWERMHFHIFNEKRKEVGEVSFDPTYGSFNIIHPSTLHHIDSSL